MGQIANQMALELFSKLKAKVKKQKEEKKKAKEENSKKETW